MNIEGGQTKNLDRGRNDECVNSDRSRSRVYGISTRPEETLISSRTWKRGDDRSLVVEYWKGKGQILAEGRHARRIAAS